MKKIVVLLTAGIILSIGTANANVTSPVTEWLDKTSNAISSTEQRTTQTIDTKKKEAAARKAAREKAAAERKAAAQAQKNAIKNEVNAQKSFWKKLFTWDWD